MIELPKEFKQSVINRYEEKGIKWLNSIDKIIEKYEKKFSLDNMQLIENLSMNIVILATSSKYGQVALKIGTPGKSSIGEINYIRNLNSKYFAKCYYTNKKDRVIILEKITPGYSLYYLKNQEERINIYSTILNNILISDIPDNKFRSYEEIIKEKINYVYSNNQECRNILYIIERVNKLYSEIKKLNLPKYVLHDDLQHKNILKSENGWKVIDPHGIIGEKIFETTQFIRSELKYSNFDNLDEIVTFISVNIKEDKNLIYKALYISMLDKIVFFLQAKYDKKLIDYNIKLSEEIYKYVK